MQFLYFLSYCIHLYIRLPFVIGRDEKLSEFENKLSSAQTEIQRLGNERTELIAKV